MTPVCKECHHRPSCRIADYGADCQCECHDVADASPLLLAACKKAFAKATTDTLARLDQPELYALRTAIAAAEGDNP